jgi:tRNA-specific 2-thiouridylase
MRIVVAMSGGVDSSVAAARLHAAGHEVVGVTLHLWDYPEDAGRAHARCCAPEDQYDARRAADRLGFAHYTFDRRAPFAQKVVAPFVDAYLAGETPSPCTACNREVKLAELVRLADKLGAERVATGHYARVMRDARGAPYIARGVDLSKDQSYFLFACTRAQLERLVFPLGDATKSVVRDEAVRLGIPGATKGESQELCFAGAGAGAYAAFVEERARGRVRPGPIVDDGGRVVGEHAGIHRFTVGQRKGLGVALGRPAFVTRIDPATATVRLGGEADLDARALDLDDVALAPDVTLPLRAHVRVRYRHEGAPGEVRATAEGARVVLDAPVRAATRGQMAVLYDGDRVLGGGRIARVASSLPDAPSGSILRA